MLGSSTLPSELRDRDRLAEPRVVVPQEPVDVLGAGSRWPAPAGQQGRDRLAQRLRESRASSSPGSPVSVCVASRSSITPWAGLSDQRATAPAGMTAHRRRSPTGSSADGPDSVGRRRSRATLACADARVIGPCAGFTGTNATPASAALAKQRPQRGAELVEVDRLVATVGAIAAAASLIGGVDLLQCLPMCAHPRVPHVVRQVSPGDPRPHPATRTTGHDRPDTDLARSKLELGLRGREPRRSGGATTSNCSPIGSALGPLLRGVGLDDCGQRPSQAGRAGAARTRSERPSRARPSRWPRRACSPRPTGQVQTPCSDAAPGLELHDRAVGLRPGALDRRQRPPAVPR